MARLRPYIGVTGFMARCEVDAVLDAFSSTERLLMVGVLASAKTLAEPPVPVRWPNRYPVKERIAEIFVRDPRAANLIHYATDSRETLGRQLNTVQHFGGDALEGYQLNVRWPNVDDWFVANVKDRRTILQLGRNAVETAGGTPQTVAAALKPYAHLVSDVLFDPSGGAGKAVDLDRAAHFLEAVDAAYPWLGLGVAGGLSADTLGDLAPLRKRFPSLSIDAEGRLRDSDDALNLEKAVAYVRRALEIFS